MGHCINHPDREISYLYMKHNLYLYEECLQCRDPDIYCKFRPSCPICFLTKRQAGLISNAMTYVDFSSNNRYMDNFTSALFLPHADLSQFPSVT